MFFLTTVRELNKDKDFQEYNNASMGGKYHSLTLPRGIIGQGGLLPRIYGLGGKFLL